MNSQDEKQPSLNQDNSFVSCLLPKYTKTEIQSKFLQIYNLDKKQIIYDLRFYNSMIKSENTFDIFNGLVKLRRALSLNNEEEYQQFINNIIEQNMIAPIIHIINSSSNQLILCESLWVITNLTAGSSDLIKFMLQNGLLQCLLKKFNLQNYHNHLIEFVCSIYGNIAADGIQFSDQLIEMNTLNFIIEFAQKKIQVEYNQKQIKTVAWVISNYRNFIPLNQYFIPVLQIFSKWIHLNLDYDTQTCICWTYSSFLKHPNCMEKLINLGVVPRLIQLVESDHLGLFHSNLTIIQNLLENQNYLGYLIGFGIIPCFEKLLSKHHRIQHRTKKILPAIYLISNSTIEFRKQFLNSQIIESLIALSSTSQLSDKNILYQIFGNIIEILETHTFQDQKLTTCLKVSELVVMKQITENKRSKTHLEIIQNFCNKLRKDCIQNQFLDEQQQELIQRIMEKSKIIEQNE